MRRLLALPCLLLLTLSLPPTGIAADTSVALATGHVDELIAACEPL